MIIGMDINLDKFRDTKHLAYCRRLLLLTSKEVAYNASPQPWKHIYNRASNPAFGARTMCISLLGEHVLAVITSHQKEGIATNDNRDNVDRRETQSAGWFL